MTRTLPAFLAAACCGAFGLATQPGFGDPPETPGSLAPAPKSPTPDPDLTQRVLDAAAQYSTWTRISDEAHWAPTLCRMPAPEGAQLSESADSGTHGWKLYFLFAKDAPAYRAIARAKAAASPPDGKPPVASSAGQVLVKESWTFKEVDRVSVPTLPRTGEIAPREHPREYAFADGKAYKTDERAGLFVMLKLDAATPGTDQGWVYATVSPDHKVTAVGKIASCMECHVKATEDRQFGPAWARPAKHGAPAPAPAPAPGK